MTRSIPLLLLLAALTSGAARAQPVPPPPPVAPVPPAAGQQISLQFSGRLGDALKELAARGGINLVVTGKLDTPAEIYLSNVSAEEALAIVAETHQLKLSRQGSIWTVRPLHPGEPQSAAAQQDVFREAQQTLREARQEAQEAAREAQREAQEAAREAADTARELQRDVQQERIQEQVSRAERRLNGMGRDISHYGRPVIVREGETVRNAVAYGGPLEVYGHVKEDAVSFGGPVKLGPGAVVGGDVVAFGGPIDRAEGAQVHGDVISMSGAMAGSMQRSFRGFRGDPAGADTEAAWEGNTSSRSNPLFGFFFFFVVLFGVGFVGLMFAPDTFRSLTAQLHHSPVRSGAIGAASVVGIPLATLITLPTVVVPLAIIVVVGVGYLMGIAAIGHEIGKRIPVPFVRKTQALVLAVGLLVLLVAFEIPILGAFTFVVVSLLSLGMLVRALWGRRRRMGIPQPA